MLPQIGGLGLEKSKTTKLEKHPQLGIDSIAEAAEHTEEPAGNLVQSQTAVGPHSTRAIDKNQLMFKSRLKAPGTGIGKGNERNLTPRGLESGRMSKHKSE